MKKNKDVNTLLKEDNNNSCSDSQRDILKDPNLMARIIKEVHKFFSGEEDTIIALVISICTRLVNNCNPESRNLVLSEMSGSGKDRLVRAVCSILLREEKTYFHRSKLTQEAFTYWHSKEDNWSWDGKVVHIEDPTPDLMNCQTMKTIASGEKRATIVDKQKAKDISIKGKPNLIITTFEGFAELELIRRYPFIHMDKSDSLTKQVKNEVARMYQGEKSIELDKVLHSALSRGLIQHSVVIPFAKELVSYFPDRLIMRTHFRRFLDYISASACLYQYQREKDDNNRIKATWDDYEMARITYLKSVSNDTHISLNSDQEELIRILRRSSNPMFVSDIHEKIPKSRDWIYKNCEILKRYDIIKQGSMFKADANKNVTTYVLSGCLRSFDLPYREVVWLSRFSPELKIIDDRRVKDGYNRIFAIYYNKTNKTIQPKEKDKKTTTDNHRQPNNNKNK